jgi:hypothetical protein
LRGLRGDRWGDAGMLCPAPTDQDTSAADYVALLDERAAEFQSLLAEHPVAHFLTVS